MRLEDPEVLTETFYSKNVALKCFFVLFRFVALTKGQVKVIQVVHTFAVLAGEEHVL